ncbi:MAG: hypothetical protein DCF20_04235 [Pseudanabaena sp.]|nr:MAG: hypothetical protein DCF20_04235 [Pseudanabaena sp.]
MYSKDLLIFDKFNPQKTFDIDKLKRLVLILSIFFFVLFVFCISPSNAASQPLNVENITNAESDFYNLDRINPLPTVYQLVAEKKFVEADDYLSYFMDYDYVNEDPEAISIKDKIQQTRKDWLYQLGKVKSGIFFGESDEVYGQIAVELADFVGVGDIRDLGKNGINFVQGKEVNKVSTALSSIGLLATGYAVYSNLSPVAVGAKSSITILKIANKLGKIPPWLGKFLQEGAAIAVKTKDLSHLGGLFSDIGRLSEKVGLPSTIKLLEKSKNVADFKELIEFGTAFGKKTSTLLKIGGDKAIKTYQRIGKVDNKLYEEVATFGEDGLDYLEKQGGEEVIEQSRRRITKLEKGIIDSGKTVKYKGQKFVKRDVFDIKYIDADRQSNLDRMTQGLAPIGRDEKPIHLHHMKQQNNGTIAELTSTEHNEHSKTLHRYAEKSQIDRNEFAKLRAAYWKERTKDFA